MSKLAEIEKAHKAIQDIVTSGKVTQVEILGAIQEVMDDPQFQASRAKLSLYSTLLTTDAGQAMNHFKAVASNLDTADMVIKQSLQLIAAKAQAAAQAPS